MFYLTRVIAFVVALACFASSAPSQGQQSQPRRLVVHTYESFSAPDGLGAEIKPLFEDQCDCDLVYRSFEDAGTILNNLRIERSQSDADVVVGFDNNMSAEAKRFFLPHGLGGAYDRLFDLPIPWVDSIFVPFDYGWFAFVYDRTKVSTPPQSFEELLKSNLRLIIQDPRTSSPGLGFLLWVKRLYGDRAEEVWQRMFQQIVVVTKSWSEAYGLFLQGEADMVMSYTTSPAYHIIAENNVDYRAALFSEGQYVQIELAAIAKTTKNEDLARDFLRFLISARTQRALPTRNWMFPVLGQAQQVALPQAFKDIKVRMEDIETLTIPAGRILQERKKWINEWRAAGFKESLDQ